MPYWRLSGFYLFYFAALGALVPYWGLYLQDQGLTPLAIGRADGHPHRDQADLAPLWGWLADRSGARMRLVRLACLLAALTFAAIFVARGFWGIAAVMFVASFFWNAALPQMEAVTFNHLGARANRYASVRLWGSVGFILTVAAVGWLLDGRGTWVVPWVVLALFGGIWLASLLVPDRGHAPCGSGGGVPAPTPAPAGDPGLPRRLPADAGEPRGLLRLLLHLPQGGGLRQRRGGRPLGLGGLRRGAGLPGDAPVAGALRRPPGAACQPGPRGPALAPDRRLVDLVRSRSWPRPCTPRPSAPSTPPPSIWPTTTSPGAPRAAARPSTTA